MLNDFQHSANTTYYANLPALSGLSSLRRHHGGVDFTRESFSQSAEGYRESKPSYDKLMTALVEAETAAMQT